MRIITLINLIQAVGIILIKWMELQNTHNLIYQALIDWISVKVSWLKIGRLGLLEVFTEICRTRLRSSFPKMWGRTLMAAFMMFFTCSRTPIEILATFRELS